MHKIFFSLIAIAALALGGFFIFSPHAANQKHAASDYKNATYIIDGQPVTLVNGVSEVEAAPGSASKITTRYFGNEVRHDFNGDGREDVAFLLTQSTGGSGTFYYVVAALNTQNGYVGSEGLLLGDRIAPQTTELKDDFVVVNYADRAPGESFAVAPSVGKTIILKLDTKTLQFGEVVQNFEGEADPNKMTLTQKGWTWVSVAYSDGKKITPNKPLAFTLTFSPGGKFSATTDCNRVAGSYTTKDSAISFSDMISTEMYCAGSQETDFTSMLSKIGSYHFTSKGELVFDLKMDSGSAVFK